MSHITDELFKDIPPVTENEGESTPSKGTEALFVNSDALSTVLTPKMFDPKNVNESLGTICCRDDNRNKGLLLQCFPDKNKTHFNLYISESTELDSSNYQNKFCRFLDKLSNNQSVTIYLGGGVYGAYLSFSMGSMIDSMIHCKGCVKTIVGGRASCMESILWLFGHARALSKYGTLSFCGVGETLKSCLMWKGYFNFMYSKARDLGFITDNDVVDLLTTNNCVTVTYEEYLGKVNGATPPEK